MNEPDPDPAGASRDDELDAVTRDFAAFERRLRDLFRSLPRDEGDGQPLAGGYREGLVLDDFRIVRCIGSGGMATVYEAVQMSLDRRVALKVLPSLMGLSQRAVDTFRREALALGRQQHPGIVTIFRVGEADGVHYIAQQLVGTGRTLADEIEQRRRDGLPPQDPRTTIRWCIDVADALQHAHASGVVHRDLKPSNILLADDGRPMVSDFGLATIGRALAIDDAFVGTPAYAAPEQAAGRQVDHRADIFSLGVTLFEAATLTIPFGGDSVEDILRAVATCEPPLLDRLNPAAPAILAAACARALAKHPARRFQSMAEFAMELRRILHGEPAANRGSRLHGWMDRLLRTRGRRSGSRRSRADSVGYLESWVDSVIRERGGVDPHADARDLYLLAIAQHAARNARWRATRQHAERAWESCDGPPDSLARLRDHVHGLW